MARVTYKKAGVDIDAAERFIDREMFRTLNMGIGMALVVAPGDAERAVALFGRRGQRASVIGEIVRGKHEVAIL
jgi:phosphoribosylformylglycinamidine cyclo-ligase